METDTMTNTTVIPGNKKLFSMNELKELGLSRYKIIRLANDGRLIRLNRTYFENAQYTGDESDFYYVRAVSNDAVICLMSAAVYYDLTTYIPDAVDVALPRKSRISTIPAQTHMHFHYFTDDRHRTGITQVRRGENGFQIYNIEKTVVDAVYYRERIGIEFMKEILLSYLQKKSRNLNLLLKYAQLLKCEKTMRSYLEVLV